LGSIIKAASGATASILPDSSVIRREIGSGPRKTSPGGRKRRSARLFDDPVKEKGDLFALSDDLRD
jgi:hypothetical protein